METNHEKKLDDVTMEDWTSLFYQLAEASPECPNCNSKTCYDWVRAFVQQNVRAATEGGGPLHMLGAIIHKVGGSIVLKEDEIMALPTYSALRINPVIHTPTGNVGVRIALVPIDELIEAVGENEPIEDWPDIVGDSGQKG